MNHLSLNAIGHHIPPRTLNLADHYSQFGLAASDTRIYSRFYGIDKIPVADESMLEMMLRAAEPLVNSLGKNKEKIKFILAPRTAPVISPFGTSLVRELGHRLQLTAAVPFVLAMNKCVSTLRALELSQHLLQSVEPGDMALVVTGETVFTKENRILPNITVTADGAAAALVSLSATNSHQLLAMDQLILGEYAAGAWMPISQVTEFGKLFDVSMMQVIQNAINKAGITLEQARVIFPHNVNVPCWRGFAKHANISLQKIYLDNIKRASHCFNSDLFINLSTALAEQKLSPGDYYVMATVGVGAMFGAAVFRY